MTVPETSAECGDDPQGGTWRPDFHWVMDGLAVGACFPIERAAQLADEHAISAVVDLRGEDCDDAALLAAHGIDFLHLPTPDMLPAPVAVLDRGVDFVKHHLDGDGRVLIHCQHGIGRSALLALCVMVDSGFEPLDALRQAKDRRMRVSPSEAQYRGWSEWLASRGDPVPSYHEFGCIAYRHIAHG